MLKEHTAILELVDSGEGFSKNEVTSPESSISKIPNLCVSAKKKEKKKSLVKQS